MTNGPRKTTSTPILPSSSATDARNEHAHDRLKALLSHQQDPGTLRTRARPNA